MIEFASNVIDSHLCNIIKDLEKDSSEKPKTALLRPIVKKNERNKVENYRPVSILNGMSKIYDRCIHNSLSSYAKTILSNSISAPKKSYSSKKNIENWKKSQDLQKIVKNHEIIKILLVLFSWISPKLLTVFLMIYLLQNFEHTVYQRMQ